MFVLFVVYAARVFIRNARAAHSRSSFNSRMPERHSGDAGAIPADRSNFYSIHTAGASSRSLVSKTSPARGSTETPCHLHHNCGVAKW